MDPLLVCESIIFLLWSAVHIVCFTRALHLEQIAQRLGLPLRYGTPEEAVPSPLRPALRVHVSPPLAHSQQPAPTPIVAKPQQHHLILPVTGRKTRLPLSAPRQNKPEAGAIVTSGRGSVIQLNLLSPTTGGSHPVWASPTSAAHPITDSVPNRTVDLVQARALRTPPQLIPTVLSTIQQPLVRTLRFHFSTQQLSGDTVPKPKVGILVANHPLTVIVDPPPPALSIPHMLIQPTLSTTTPLPRPTVPPVLPTVPLASPTVPLDTIPRAPPTVAPGPPTMPLATVAPPAIPLATVAPALIAAVTPALIAAVTPALVPALPRTPVPKPLSAVRRDFPYYGRRYGLVASVFGFILSIDLNGSFGLIVNPYNGLLATNIQALVMVLFSVLFWFLTRTIYRILNVQTPFWLRALLFLFPTLFLSFGAICVVLTTVKDRIFYRHLYSVMESTVVMGYVVLVTWIYRSLQRQLSVIIHMPAQTFIRDSESTSVIVHRAMKHLLRLLRFVIPCGLLLAIAFYYVSIPVIQAQLDDPAPAAPTHFADASLQFVMFFSGWAIKSGVCWFCFPKAVTTIVTATKSTQRVPLPLANLGDLPSTSASSAIVTSLVPPPVVDAVTSPAAAVATRRRLVAIHTLTYDIDALFKSQVRLAPLAAATARANNSAMLDLMSRGGAHDEVAPTTHPMLDLMSRGRAREVAPTTHHPMLDLMSRGNREADVSADKRARQNLSTLAPLPHHDSVSVTANVEALLRKHDLESAHRPPFCQSLDDDLDGPA